LAPFAGTYNTRDELFEKVYKPLLPNLSGNTVTEIRSVIVSGDVAVVELIAAGSGLRRMENRIVRRCVGFAAGMKEIRSRR